MMLAIQLSRLVGIPVGILLLAIRIKTDHVINTQDCDGCLRCKLERFDLGDCGFQHASILVVTHCPSYQIQSVPKTTTNTSWMTQS